MTKTPVALALATLAVLAAATTTQAAALSLRTASDLAHRVALKEIRGRHIVAFHVTHPQRHGASEIDFAYDDRSSANIYCTARVIVLASQSGRIGARVTQPHCSPIPHDALAFESVVANALRQVNSRRGAVDASVAALRHSLRPCAGMHVPNADRSGVRAILTVAALEALERPVDQQVHAYATSLSHVATSTAVLRASQTAWTDYLATLAQLPSVTDPCGSIRAWAGRSYHDPTPIDFTAYNRLNSRAAADSAAIARAAKRLGADGVFPQDVTALTPAGLLLQSKVKSLVTSIG